MEKHFVYIIHSISHDKYYKGYSEEPLRRLGQHNNGESRYTSLFCPWELVYTECFDTKREALIREKGLKKYSKAQIKELLGSNKNQISKINPPVG